MHAFGHRFAVCFAAAIVALFMVVYVAMLAQARLPDDASGMMVLLFRPGTADRVAVDAIVDAGGRPVGSGLDGSGVWTAYGEDHGFVKRVREGGAWLALRQVPVFPLVTGCLIIASPQKLNLQNVKLH